MSRLKSNSNGRIWLGVILIIIGGIIFLNNFQFNFLHINIFSWPIILIIIGTLILINNRRSGFAFVLILVGIISLISRYMGMSFRYFIGEYWPIFIIGFGIYLIFKRANANDNDELDYTESEEHFLDTFSIFGDITKKVKTKNFLGGKITSLFSDLKIDLRECELKEKKELDSITIFGGTEIYIPIDWKVIFKATTIFGGFEDKRSKFHTVEQESENVLVVKGLVLFGGGEIKN